MLRFPKSKIPEKVPWTLTETGRMVSSSCVVIACTGAFSGYVLLHGYFVDKYKEIVQMYSNGLPTPVKPEVQKRAEEVLEKCVAYDRDKDVSFFTVHGFNLFHAGSTLLRWGVKIGIPDNFSYKTVKDIPKESLQIPHFPLVNWDSEAGKELQNSLVLSERAQKFAIAHEIFWCQTYYVHAHGLAAAFSVLSAYLLSSQTNRRFNLFGRPRWIRMILYGLCSALCWVTFISFKDATTLWWDKVSDKKAASIDPEYLQGGIEFYEKLLSKNRAIRTLMGKPGEKLYTISGNDETFIRTRHLPYTTRLDFLKEKLEHGKKELNS